MDLNDTIHAIASSTAECYCLQYCGGMEAEQRKRMFDIMYDYTALACKVMADSIPATPAYLPSFSEN